MSDFYSAASAAVIARAAQVRLMIFDVDGVLTDGGLYYGADGEPVKRFNALDGHGIKLIQQFGVATAIITARQSPIVLRRAKDLGISHVFQGVHDKRQAFEQLLQQTGIAADACGYLGDDVIDLPILCRAGFPACVANAHPAVKSRVAYVTQASGGHGAARELCDLLLHAQGNYEAALAPYLA
ncbi:KdsC family phosphatase [Herbaspirillum autotrophicum]|uniref:KdsC family phosphatase n=1 Tax=Herbaspirillum autotrophicum TaxID=180195 RepID=UPI00067DD3C9|nr:HAD family hydrolase [Herbaspirillum autotrophicum]